MTTGENADQSTRALSFPSGTPRERPFSDVQEPGCYLATESGRVIRLTEELLVSSERSRMCPPETWSARLSENPQETLAVLREIAGRNGYFVNF